MKTKKMAFMAVMWLAAFGLFGAPTAPATSILQTVGGQAHAYPAWWIPWSLQCPRDWKVNYFWRLDGVRAFAATWICQI